MINNVIDLKSRRRRNLEQDAFAFHLAHQAEAFQPPRHYIEQLRFRLRRRLGVDAATLRTRGAWENAIDDLFRLEMTDLLSQEKTPPAVREMFPEFVDEVWRD